MNKVYLVVGADGAHEDREWWLVAAYTKWAEARLHAEKANAYVKANGGGGESEPQTETIRRAVEKNNPYDPDCQITHFTEYKAVEEVLVRCLDEYLKLNLKRTGSEKIL